MTQVESGGPRRGSASSRTGLRVHGSLLNSTLGWFTKKVCRIGMALRLPLGGSLAKICYSGAGSFCSRVHLSSGGSRRWNGMVPSSSKLIVGLFTKGMLRWNCSCLLQILPSGGSQKVCHITADGSQKVCYGIAPSSANSQGLTLAIRKKTTQKQQMDALSTKSIQKPKGDQEQKRT